MRLNKIKLAGFKSFVDPTSILFPTNLTGIVGPNGCGKSNVIDAVRWVMGESSAKNLRGDSMADVIFNGSTSRKPVGQASIELIFDNSDASVGGQYAQYNEISVKRTVSRDGQSSYFLNATRCRRRDITDIFLGTGLGPRSYSIIEQGMISRVIEAKPEELRIYLEEAAGISKYKERRRETENRIRHTRENLDRLNDLREEIGKQLAHLQRQAKTAERFKELKQEERLLKGQLQALRWQALNAESEQQEQAIKAQELALEQRTAELRHIEAEIEKQREAHTEASESFNEVQGRYYRAGADIARVEQAIAHAKERAAQAREDLTQVERAWQEAQLHLEHDQRRIAEMNKLLAENEPALARAEQAQQASAAALAQAEQRLNDWQQQWEDFNRQAAEPSQTAQVERTRIQHLEQQQAQLAQRGTRLGDELKGIDTAQLERELATLSTQQAEQEQALKRLQEGLATQQGQIRTHRERNAELAAQLDQDRGRLQSLRGRRASLEALQQAALGKRQGAVNDWLKGQGLQDRLRLAQGIEVEPEWARAVEAVLGFHLEAVCVEGLDPVAAMLGKLEHGAVALFDTRAAVPAIAAGTGEPLAGKVKSEWALGGLLAGVYAAPDLGEALALRARLQPHESVITRDGIWLGAGWLRVARDADEKAGVLHREQELKEIAGQIAALERRVAELQGELERGRGELQALEQARDRQQAEHNQAHRRHAELQAQAGGRQSRLEQLRQRAERLREELKELDQQRAHAQSEHDAARSRLHRALEAMEQLSQRREALLGERDQTREAVQQARVQAQADRDAAHGIALRLQSTRSSLSSTQQNLERMQGQLAQFAQRREALGVQLADADQPIAALGAELDTLLEQRSAVEKELIDARRSAEAIDHRVRELGGERNTVEQQVQEQRGSLEQARMGWQEVKVRRQTLLEQVQESGYELQTLLAEMPPEASAPEWEQRCEQISQRIQRLGAINLAAIDEFKEQSERKDYLDAQHADLTEALETLENAIQKIDRETRTRFKETYDKVNTGLQTLFPRLFGGGHAYLELTGENLLDTGVTVMARPPGKRNSSIHLLSGGEKALTAVALVFAIFELNPAPFCLLDEVDAPLDDANVGRFCEMVREMSKQVQFIFITHNKITMELAEQLNGVTMHEPGVSRLVSVDVDEAHQMAVAQAG